MSSEEKSIENAIKNQFCAFIDILGFKNKMQNFDEAMAYYKQFFTSYEAFSKLHNQILTDVAGVLGDKSNNKEEQLLSVESMIFSDSIVLYSENWNALLFQIANVMSYLLNCGFLFRGGVGYGKHFVDIHIGQTYIVSEGLIQAVEIESKISNYPRIVISQEALDEIISQMDSLYDLDNMLIQDEDNYWFINPFFLNPDIGVIYEKVNENIEKYCNEKYVEKYIWMKELCEYFHMKRTIRENPRDYYLSQTTRTHFFYPKIFSVAVFLEENYVLTEDIYKQEYSKNVEEVIIQNERRREKYN